MAAVGNDDRPCSAAVGSVDQHTSVTSFLNDPFDRSRLRADNRNDPVGCYDITKTNIDQFDIHTFTLSELLDVLDLFPDFFYLSFYLYDHLGQRKVVGFGGDGIRFTVKFLNQKVQLAPYRLVSIKYQLKLL